MGDPAIKDVDTLYPLLQCIKAALHLGDHPPDNDPILYIL